MKKAVILLSGGLDSATVLAIASQHYQCYAISFDYGQRSRVEIESAKQLCEAFAVKTHNIFNIDIGQFQGSALTDHSLTIPDSATDDIPITYVPARNTVFLSVALGWAEVLGARDIFMGANDVDYSGYPDCRPEYLQAFEKMANLATKAGVEGDSFSIHAPLLKLSKAEIIHQGQELGIDYAVTCSCYNADERGRACGRCDSCRIRAQGFREAGVADPTQYQ